MLLAFYFHNKIKNKTMNLDKHIYEGWTVQNFIDELTDCLDYWTKQKIKTREDVEKWTSENQPYYKKIIPDVVDYFCKQLNIK